MVNLLMFLLNKLRTLFTTSRTTDCPFSSITVPFMSASNYRGQISANKPWCRQLGGEKSQEIELRMAEHRMLCKHHWTSTTHKQLSHFDFVNWKIQKTSTFPSWTMNQDNINLLWWIDKQGSEHINIWIKPASIWIIYIYILILRKALKYNASQHVAACTLLLLLRLDTDQKFIHFCHGYIAHNGSML